MRRGLLHHKSKSKWKNNKNVKKTARKKYFKAVFFNVSIEQVAKRRNQNFQLIFSWSEIGDKKLLQYLKCCSLNREVTESLHFNENSFLIPHSTNSAVISIRISVLSAARTADDIIACQFKSQEAVELGRADRIEWPGKDKQQKTIRETSLPHY